MCDAFLHSGGGAREAWVSQCDNIGRRFPRVGRREPACYPSLRRPLHQYLEAPRSGIPSTLLLWSHFIDGNVATCDDLLVLDGEPDPAYHRGNTAGGLETLVPGVVT